MEFKRNKINEKDGNIINREHLESKNEDEGYEKVSNAFEKINTILETKR